MKNILSQELSSACSTLIFKSTIIAFISLSFYNIFISPYCLMDTIEHIHASYLINIGLIPYHDFFEHHNPLLWYILSPLTQLLYNDINIIHIARFIACCFHLVNLFLFYKIIEKFLYNKNIAQTSILILLSIPYIWRDIIVLRPDIFMHTTFLAALYFLFTYFNKKKTIYLILSYSLLSLSFLFLQKILLYCFVFIILNIFYIYKKQIHMRDFLISAFIATIPLLMFALYIYHHNALTNWFYYSFTFNIYMKEYFDNYTSGVPTIINIIALLFLFSIINNYQQHSTETNIIYILYLTSVFLLFYWHPHTQYYLLYFMFSSIFLGKMFENHYKQLKFIIPILCIFIWGLYSTYPSKNSQKAYQDYLISADFITKETSDEKNIVDIEKTSAVIFQKPFGYYWFGYHNVAIIDILTHPTHKLDLNQQIQKLYPTYIRYQENFLPPLNDMIVYNKSIFFIKRNQLILKKAKADPSLTSQIINIDSDYHNIDTDWIENNYEKTDIPSIWKKIPPHN